MERSTKLIDRLRLDAMFTFMHGLRPDKTMGQLFTNFRHRNSTRWSEMEKREALEQQRLLGQQTKASRLSAFDEDDDESSDMHGTTVFSSRKLKEARKIHDFHAQQQKSLQQTFAEESTPQSLPSDNPFVPCNWDAVEPNTILQDTMTRANNIVQTKLPHTMESLESSEDDVPHSRRSKKVQKFLNSLSLSRSQKLVVQEFNKSFEAMRDHLRNNQTTEINFAAMASAGFEPPRALLTGDPGSGKSHTIDTICKLASMHGVGHVVTTSYNGIAAVNIDGSTIPSMFRIIENNGNRSALHLDDDTLAQIRDEICSASMSMLIVDEVSTIDARIIAMLDMRLQQIHNNCSSFGGVPVLFAGDFNQLGPVQKVFLPMDMINYALRLKKLGRLNDPPIPSATTTTTDQRKQNAHADDRLFDALDRLHSARKRRRKSQKQEDAANRFKPTSLTYRGCFLLSSFARFHLREQQRARGDSHSDFVRHLSEGKPIHLDKILEHPPLSAEDVKTNPKEWMFAPTLVTSNHERLEINRMKAWLWAKKHGTHVFKWRCRIGKQENRPDQNTMEKVES